MKILHTSDLHLGKLWRGTSLWADQDRVLDTILALCDTHDVDMLLVTGDVLSDRVDGNKPAEVACRFLKKLQGYLEQGRAVFLLRGNHDPFDIFQLMNLMLTELAGKDGLPLVVANLPGVYSVPGHSSQVVALPYLSPSWLRTQPFTLDTTPGEQVVQLTGMLAFHLRQLCTTVSDGQPTIFAGHVMISGATIRPDMEFESGYHRELWLHPSDLPQFTSYNALGHIHLGQQIAAAGKPSWYAGAPNRLDIGERNYRPQVLLVTTPDTPGGTATIESVPIEVGTRWIVEELHDVEAVGPFSQSLDDTCIGTVSISDIPVSYRGEIETMIHEVAPRVTIQWRSQPITLVPNDDDDGPSHHDVFGTVHDFLVRTLSEEPERQRRLVEAFDKLWGETSEVAG